MSVLASAILQGRELGSVFSTMVCVVFWESCTADAFSTASLRRIEVPHSPHATRSDNIQ